MAALFVAREWELERLRGVLDGALAGRGRVCFVTGEAGAGKTTLTEEFAHRAQSELPELLFAVGNCNAQTGIGDPYLPFREVLCQLTGDVENKLMQGAISEENATRLKSFLSFSGRAIVDLGPDLIDIFLPGASLLARAGSLVSGEPNWASQLKSLRDRGRAGSVADLGSRSASPASEQDHIFEQYTRVLIELAQRQPIVLLIDDLHWADESSTALLFHLARRIGESRILVLGTYRPEDIAVGRADRRHPLESVVNEIKRLHGDVHLNLGEEGGTPGRAFIDALLDHRPNRLGKPFRDKLLGRTRGQPLFTRELLGDMLDRGDLVENDAGEIVEASSLDWNRLPARVEGVIEERIRRLSPELQDLLTVASVEGEVFSAQVVARIQGIGERAALQSLDRDLDRQHRLVREDSLLRIGNQRLSQYRFRHNLIQQYLYGSIGASQRELLHEDIARHLEELCAGRNEDIAGRLARHYELAQHPERAAEHYLAVGERALRLFAGGEAADMLQRGLRLAESLPETAENLERKVKLQLALGRAQWKQALAPESMTTFLEAARTAMQLGVGDYLALAALGYDDPRFRFNFPAEPAVDLLEKALDALGDGDSVLRVQVVCALIRAQGHRMNEVVLATLAENAVAMSRRLQDPAALYAALNAGTQALRRPDQIRERLALRGEAVQVAAASGDRASLLDAIMFRIIDLLALAQIDAVDADLASMKEVVDETGEPFYEYCLLNLRAMRALLDGRFEQAEGYAQSAMNCTLQMKIANAEGVHGLLMFSIRRLQGRLEGLAPVIRHFVTTHSAAESWRPGLALIYSEIGDRESARAEFDALAEVGFDNLPRDSLWLTCISYLADVCAFLGDTGRARELHGILHPYGRQGVVVGNSVTCNGAVSRSLGRLAAVLQDWEQAEAHFEHALEFNTQLKAKPWLATTQYQYAGMLMDRARGTDTQRATKLLTGARKLAGELGMHGLETRIVQLGGHDG